MAASGPHVDVSNGNENSTKSPADKQFLDTFWKLAVPSDNERISGATTLLQILIKKQNENKEVSNLPMAMNGNAAWYFNKRRTWWGGRLDAANARRSGVTIQVA